MLMSWPDVGARFQNNRCPLAAGDACMRNASSRHTLAQTWTFYEQPRCDEEPIGPSATKKSPASLKSELLLMTIYGSRQRPEKIVTG